MGEDGDGVLRRHIRIARRPPVGERVEIEVQRVAVDLELGAREPFDPRRFHTRGRRAFFFSRLQAPVRIRVDLQLA